MVVQINGGVLVRHDAADDVHVAENKFQKRHPDADPAASLSVARAAAPLPPSCDEAAAKEADHGVASLRRVDYARSLSDVCGDEVSVRRGGSEDEARVTAVVGNFEGRGGGGNLVGGEEAEICEGRVERLGRRGVPQNGQK